MMDPTAHCPPAVRRFEAKLSEDDSGCWVWTASKNKAGYGQFVDREAGGRYAHRWSYEYHIAPIPPGLDIDHLCRNTSCVNPWHMDPVPRSVNVKRGGNTLKTQCAKGHPYDEVNTYFRPAAPGLRPGRDCRECRRIANRKAFRKRRANG